MGILRRNRQRRDGAGADAVVAVEVGYDRFHAQVLAEACRAEGCSVELLTMDDSGQAPGLPALMAHRLLVRESELPAVQAVLARTR